MERGGSELSEGVQNVERALKYILANRDLIDQIILMLKELSEGKVIKVKVDINTDTLYYEGVSRDEEVKALQILVDSKLVDKVIYDRVISCPKCNSYRIKVRYLCPYCDSFNLEKTRIIQHVLCGYTGSEYSFYAKGKFEKRICPNCGEEVREEGVDFVVLTKMFQCLNCGRRVPDPEVRYACDKCGHEFTTIDSEYVPLYMYRISELGKMIHEKNVVTVALIEEVVKKHGFRMIKPPKIKGLSGIEHEFDVIGVADKTTLLIDVIRAVEEGKILSVTVKATEFLTSEGSSTYYIICYEEMSPILSALSNNSRTIMIKIPNSINKLIDQLEDTLKRIKGS